MISLIPALRILKMDMYVCVSASSDIQVDFKMPKEAVVGSSIDLRCEWRILGGSGLYSVKWYKDDHEFFRFLPDSSQRTQIFSRPGVKVEVCPFIYVCFVKICIITICVSLIALWQELINL